MVKVIVGTILGASLGVLCWSAPVRTAGPNLLNNPGFETGTLGSWTFSSTLWNCLADKNAASIPVCSDPAAPFPQTPSLYVHGGRYGVFLGYPEPSPLATMTQPVTFAAGGYHLDFFYRRHLTYETPDENSFEVVIGPDLASLTSLFTLTNLADTGDWISQRVSFTVAVAGTYNFGFRFYDVLGEWAVDDMDLRANPEPGTLALIAAPLAWLIWKRRRIAG